MRVAHSLGFNDTPINGFTFVPADPGSFVRDPSFTTDIIFSKGYYPDFESLVRLRNTGRAGILACWFWDNHHLFSDCMHAAMLSDVTFYAHYFKHDYFENEFAIDGAFAPLCPIMWPVTDARQAGGLAMVAPRSDALYGGYTSYAEFPERRGAPFYYASTACHRLSQSIHEVRSVAAEPISLQMLSWPTWDRPASISH